MQHLVWFILCVLIFSLREWPWAAQDVCCMLGKGHWHWQLGPQAEKCIVLWWGICKAEPSFPIPSRESMGGKSLQYFFLGIGMSSRNRLWEGTVARTEQQIALVFYSLLLVIHQDFSPDPSISIYNKNLVLGHLPAILFLCWSGSHSGENSPALEKPEQEAVSLGLFHYSLLSSPQAALNNFLPLPSMYTLQMVLEYGTEK